MKSCCRRFENLNSCFVHIKILHQFWYQFNHTIKSEFRQQQSFLVKIGIGGHHATQWMVVRHPALHELSKHVNQDPFAKCSINCTAPVVSFGSSWLLCSTVCIQCELSSLTVHIIYNTRVDVVPNRSIVVRITGPARGALRVYIILVINLHVLQTLLPSEFVHDEMASRTEYYSSNSYEKDKLGKNNMKSFTIFSVNFT